MESHSQSFIILSEKQYQERNKETMKETLRQQFLTPSDEFTPIPFWFWNHSFSEKEITRQLEDFREKGVTGFVIHPRIGIPEEIPYLSDIFMHYVRYAVEEAARLHMKVVLYDEAMYPSGSAHGMVVEGDPHFASRALRMEEFQFSDMTPDNQGLCTITPALAPDERILSVQVGIKNTEGAVVPESILELPVRNGQISFAPEDAGAWTILILIEGYSHGTIRGIHAGEDDLEPHAPASGDLLNPDAMDKFIHLTYDRYYEVLKDHFGTTIIGMFTDEPCATGRNSMAGIQPWTEGFLEWWEQCGGKVTDLPFLWLDSAKSAKHSAAVDTSASIRRKYEKAINKRLCHSYYGKISEWCANHGIALTGHPHNSDDIGFLKYFQIPGQDLVWRWVAPENGLALSGRDSTMAKCSSDAARHSGKRRNANECFGCCGSDGIGWAFTADDMKWYLDWLFVRGVNLLYPHAFFYSIEGETRYGERPPDVGPHSIWWQDYRLFSDYIKRMCWLMTDSINTTPIAILCEEDNLPWVLAKECFRRQIEFNYLEENLILSGKCRAEDGFLKIEAQNYRVLLIEKPDQISDMLASALKPFIENGGRILCLTEDKTPETLMHELEVLADIDSFCSREISLSGDARDIRVSHVVKDDQDFYLLVNEGEATYAGTAQFSALTQSSAAAQSPTYCCAEIWHPWEGYCEAADCTVTGTLLQTPVTLGRRESVIIVPATTDLSGKCLPAAEQRCNQPLPAAATQEILPVQLNWQIHRITPSVFVQEALGTGVQAINQLTDGSPDTKLRAADSTDPLTSWTCWQTEDGRSMEHFSGTVEYRAVLTAPLIASEPGGDCASGRRIFLDLGNVQEIAHLWVNDVSVGVQMWAPFVFDITDYLTDGDNTIRLTVDNCLANGINNTSRASGLLGPVQIIMKINKSDFHAPSVSGGGMTEKMN